MHDITGAFSVLYRTLLSRFVRLSPDNCYQGDEVVVIPEECRSQAVPGRRFISHRPGSITFKYCTLTHRRRFWLRFDGGESLDGLQSPDMWARYLGAA